MGERRCAGEGLTSRPSRVGQVDIRDRTCGLQVGNGSPVALCRQLAESTPAWHNDYQEGNFQCDMPRTSPPAAGWSSRRNTGRPWASAPAMKCSCFWMTAKFASRRRKKLAGGPKIMSVAWFLPESRWWTS